MRLQRWLQKRIVLWMRLRRPRNSTSGVYRTLGFKPDIVVYGKALGNGFAISAVVGKTKL